MKPVVKKILSLSIVPSILLINGCTSPSQSKVVHVSTVHAYNRNYGVIRNPEADRIIREEIISQNRPVEVEVPETYDSTLTTELKIDPEAVTADKLVIPPPTITYKYMDDPKFYTENQLRHRR
jgi:hypothetical protein